LMVAGRRGRGGETWMLMRFPSSFG
jgi:hypothetical protein